MVLIWHVITWCLFIAPNVHGRIEGERIDASLSWSSISSTMHGRRILADVGGDAFEGRLLAIMGPSGAGKTTLLEILAGVLETKNGQVVRGCVSGPLASSLDHNAAFVGQNDQFHAHQTVEETLLLAANLRLPGSTRAHCQAAVDKSLIILGLTHARHTRVGNEHSRGISGGERRRLALGCELLGNPRVIFADEPTSGLDAFQAQTMMTVLRSLASEGCTVIITIHQPSSKVWRMLDDVLLLSGGRTVYFGQRVACLPNFEALGHICPHETNPAEFVLDVISVDPKTEKACSQRVQALVMRFNEIFRPSSPAFNSSSQDGILPQGHVQGQVAPARCVQGGLVGKVLGVWRKCRRIGQREGGKADRTEGGSNGRKLTTRRAFLVLLGRTLRETRRNTFANGVRLVATVLLAGMFGVVFGGKQSLVDKIAVVVMTTINTSMIALMRSLINVVGERPIIARERRFYGALPYLLSKIVAEAPLDAFFAGLFGYITHKQCHMTGNCKSFVMHCVLEALSSSAFGQLVGSVSPSPAVALAAGPPMMLIFVIVGAVGPSGRPTIPPWLQPLRDISMIRYGCEGLCVNELSGPVAEYGVGTKGQILKVTMAALMRQLGLNGCSVEGAMKGQICVLFGCYAVFHSTSR